MAIAMYRGLELGMAHVVTDELHREKWIIYSDDNKMARIEKKVTEPLVEPLAGL